MNTGKAYIIYSKVIKLFIWQKSESIIKQLLMSQWTQSDPVMIPGLWLSVFLCLSPSLCPRGCLWVSTVQLSSSSADIFFLSVPASLLSLVCICFHVYFPSDFSSPLSVQFCSPGLVSFSHFAWSSLGFLSVIGFPNDAVSSQVFFLLGVFLSPDQPSIIVHVFPATNQQIQFCISSSVPSHESCIGFLNLTAERNCIKAQELHLQLHRPQFAC